MPYSNSWEARGVMKRFSGFISRDEFVDSALEIAADPRFDRICYIINDLSSIDGHDIVVDDDFIERIATFRIGSLQTNPNVWVAVVGGGDLAAALYRTAMSAELAGTQRTNFFDSIEDARAWVSGHRAFGV